MWASIILRLLWVSFCIRRRSIDDAFSGSNLGIQQYRALPLLLGECDRRNLHIQSLLLDFRKTRCGSHLCLRIPCFSSSRWHKGIEVVAARKRPSNSTLRTTKIALIWRSDHSTAFRSKCGMTDLLCMYDCTLQHAELCALVASRSTGKERDTESGLDYFGARYYSSSMGRFLSPDPLGPWVADASDPQSWNMYAYARNNPLTNIDPTGYDCVYLNDAGTGIDKGGIDTNSNSGECGNNGGYWVDGTFTSGTVYSNSNDVYLHGYDSSSGQLTDSYSNVVTANGNNSQINTDVFSSPNLFAY